ncbi:MarR family winged helix-turn-helix transcriptional regulator [Clostridium thermobutyricum]|uniref:MarR family winged helix-turn-helix transcriptional regulator n=1 Tax=Clostridium thermobutyricum TaxID=29372 RepID=UPI00258E0D02|nr:MarR family transcriptional regulator [Clostridium thermobutyricum]
MQNFDSLGLMRIISIKLKLKADSEIKRLGINSQQGRMLRYIYEHQNDGLIQKDIAEAFNRKSATITSMLQGLEKKGYIERRIPKDNERQKNIYLLEQGEKLISDIGIAFSKIENETLSVLTKEEAETFNKLLVKINKAL